MDATYNTTKYEVPLYNLCVNTNVGFHIVASFFISRDTKSNVAEALDIIRRWNSSWEPTNFMCDYDLREIGAIESIFKGIQYNFSVIFSTTIYFRVLEYSMYFWNLNITVLQNNEVAQFVHQNLIETL